MNDSTPSNNKTVLVIEAHSDDSCISATCFLKKLAKTHQVHFLLVTLSSVHMVHCGLVTAAQRANEYQSFVELIGGFWHKTDDLPFDSDSRLDTLPKAKIVRAIESVINDLCPDMLLIQGPSFHHDHTVVYEAAIAATRPTSRISPPEIYVMENPTYVHSLGPHTDFKPSLYVEISEEELDSKINVFSSCFESQVRHESNYLSAESLRAWARYRGIEARVEYAEAFSTYRRVLLAE